MIVLFLTSIHFHIIRTITHCPLRFFTVMSAGAAILGLESLECGGVRGRSRSGIDLFIATERCELRLRLRVEKGRRD
jgi:hypothetical protein